MWNSSGWVQVWRGKVREAEATRCICRRVNA